MGEDKAKLIVQGERLGSRIARLLTEKGLAVTVSGGDPIPGYTFIPDEQQFGGPLAALAGFQPSQKLVFVVSCDLPGFDPEVVNALAQRLGTHQACVPRLD